MTAQKTAARETRALGKKEQKSRSGVGGGGRGGEGKETCGPIKPNRQSN